MNAHFCYEGKIKEKSENNDIILGLSVRVPLLVKFDPTIYGFFGFGSFLVQIEKIVFKTQNFSDGFGSGEFLSSLILINEYASVHSGSKAELERHNMISVWIQQFLYFQVLHQISNSINFQTPMVQLCFDLLLHATTKNCILRHFGGMKAHILHFISLQGSHHIHCLIHIKQKLLAIKTVRFLSSIHP